MNIYDLQSKYWKKVSYLDAVLTKEISLLIIGGAFRLAAWKLDQETSDLEIALREATSADSELGLTD